MTDLYKFGWLPAGIQEGLSNERFDYPNIWAREKTSGPDRLTIAPSSHYIRLVEKLAECLQPPFLLLYVLAIPRGGGEAGRYQSNYSFSALQLQQFLSTYSSFLEQDARHNLWIRSEDGEGMLVYDRHNVIYAYGPVERFIATLELEGLTESKEVRFPNPHAHNYHAEFDSHETAILKNEQWTLSPLRPGDQNPD